MFFEKERGAQIGLKLTRFWSLTWGPPQWTTPSEIIAGGDWVDSLARRFNNIRGDSERLSIFIEMKKEAR